MDRIQHSSQFHQQVGIFYKLIKAKHHPNQISKETPPNFIINFIMMLSKKIKPALTSHFIQRDVCDNAKTWQKNTLSSLKTHQKIIHEQLNDFLKVPEKHWTPAFKTAKKWMRTNLGKRLSQETVSQVEKLLAATAESAERGAPCATEIHMPTRQQQPETHSPYIKGFQQPPEMNEGNTLKMEKLINELTLALELFKGRIRPGGEWRAEPETTDTTTQTHSRGLNTDQRGTQTEANATTTHHRATQTETTKRLSKGVGLQVRPPPLDTPAKETQTVLTMSRKNWDKIYEKLHLAQMGF